MQIDFTSIEYEKGGTLFTHTYEYLMSMYYGDPDDPHDIIDTLITEHEIFDFHDVIKIRFIEKWETDKKGHIVKTVQAFAPVILSEEPYWHHELKRFGRFEKLLFWIKSSDMPDNLSFEGDITYRVKIREEQSYYDEYWFIENIILPYRLRFLKPFIERIEKGELEYVLDTLLPKRKIDSISRKSSEIFIFFEPIPDECEPFVVLEHAMCELTTQRVEEIAFKEKWVVNPARGFTKQISEYALVFETFLVTLPEPEPEKRYVYVLFWIKQE